jgi:hypothetical protein
MPVLSRAADGMLDVSHSTYWLEPSVQLSALLEVREIRSYVALKLSTYGVSD